MPSEWKEEYPGKWVHVGDDFELEVSKVPNEDYEEGEAEECGLPELWEGELHFTVHFSVAEKDVIYNTFEELREALSDRLRNLHVDPWDLPKVDAIGSPEDA